MLKQYKFFIILSILFVCCLVMFIFFLSNTRQIKTKTTKRDNKPEPAIKRKIVDIPESKTWLPYRYPVFIVYGNPIEAELNIKSKIIGGYPEIIELLKNLFKHNLNSVGAYKKENSLDNIDKNVYIISFSTNSLYFDKSQAFLNEITNSLQRFICIKKLTEQKDTIKKESFSKKEKNDLKKNIRNILGKQCEITFDNDMSIYLFPSPNPRDIAVNLSEPVYLEFSKYKLRVDRKLERTIPSCTKGVSDVKNYYYFTKGIGMVAYLSSFKEFYKDFRKDTYYYKEFYDEGGIPNTFLFNRVVYFYTYNEQKVYEFYDEYFFEKKNGIIYVKKLDIKKPVPTKAEKLKLWWHRVYKKFNNYFNFILEVI